MQLSQEHKVQAKLWLLRTAIVGLTGYLLTLIPNSAYDTVGGYFGYKVLLIVCTLLVLVALFIFLSNRFQNMKISSAHTSDKQLTQTIQPDIGKPKATIPVGTQTLSIVNSNGFWTEKTSPIEADAKFTITLWITNIRDSPVNIARVQLLRFNVDGEIELLNRKSNSWITGDFQFQPKDAVMIAATFFYSRSPLSTLTSLGLGLLPGFDISADLTIVDNYGNNHTIKNCTFIYRTQL